MKIRKVTRRGVIVRGFQSGLERPYIRDPRRREVPSGRLCSRISPAAACLQQPYRLEAPSGPVGVGRSESAVKGGPADPTIFFKSLVNKFNPVDPGVRLQGGWIHATIKVRRHELDQVFSGLDQERLHFGIFNAWGSNAYIVAKPGVDMEYLRKLFRLENSDNFVVDEASS